MKVEFIEEIPRNLDEDTVYVSMTFALVAHSCFCGCGHQVVTPLSPRDWKLTFDGEAISLYPSIGNWNLECKSHYWIRNGEVIWLDRWSDDRIEAGRQNVAKLKEEYYRGRKSDIKEVGAATKTGNQLACWWSKIKSLLGL